LKTDVTLRMQYKVEMAISSMGNGCELNWHMVDEDRPRLSGTAVIAAALVVVESLDALTIEFWSPGYLLLLHGKT
jgi:hypothetical protein